MGLNVCSNCILHDVMLSWWMSDEVYDSVMLTAGSRSFLCQTLICLVQSVLIWFNSLKVTKMLIVEVLTVSKMLIIEGENCEKFS